MFSAKIYHIIHFWKALDNANQKIPQYLKNIFGIIKYREKMKNASVYCMLQNILQNFAKVL